MAAPSIRRELANNHSAGVSTARSAASMAISHSQRRHSGKPGTVPRTRPAMRADTPSPGWRELLVGILLIAAGSGLLGGLLHASYASKADTMLIVSQAIYNVISGVSGIGSSIARLGLGILQMVGFFLLAVISLGSVLAVLSGIVRVGRNALPRMNALWLLVSSCLRLVLGFLEVPFQEPGRRRQRERTSPSLNNVQPLPQSRRTSAMRSRRFAA